MERLIAEYYFLDFYNRLKNQYVYSASEQYDVKSFSKCPQPGASAHDRVIFGRQSRPFKQFEKVGPMSFGSHEIA
jgi:hypothetical protein